MQKMPALASTGWSFTRLLYIRCHEKAAFVPSPTVVFPNFNAAGEAADQFDAKWGKYSGFCWSIILANRSIPNRSGPANVPKLDSEVEKNLLQVLAESL